MSVDASRRSVGLLISLGGVLLIAGRIPSALAQTPYFAPSWTVTALACVGLLVALAGFGRTLPGPALRFGWAAVPALAWLLLFTWAGAYGGADLADVDPWFRGLVPAVLCYPLLLVRPWAAFGLAVGLTLTPPLSTMVFAGGLTPRFATDTVMHFGNLMFVGIIAGVLARLRHLEAQEAAAQRQRALELAAQASAERQLAVARLVHDEVLSTLVGALQSDGAPMVRQAAEQALSRLRTAGVAHPGAEPVTFGQVTQLVTEAVRAGGVAVEVAAENLPDAELPRVAADALVQATAEAVRNAARHGGARVRVTISSAEDPGRLRIRIEDDGPGFDPAGLPPDRLGVRQSIDGRLQAAGGRAGFGQAPGGGTRVDLRWPA